MRRPAKVRVLWEVVPASAGRWLPRVLALACHPPSTRWQTPSRSGDRTVESSDTPSSVWLADSTTASAARSSCCAEDQRLPTARADLGQGVTVGER